MYGKFENSSYDYIVLTESQYLYIENQIILLTLY